VTVGPPAAPSPGRRLIWLILTVSLTLNLFFVAGAVWIRMHPPPGRMVGPVARMRYVAGQLNLDPQHQQEFERYFRILRARIGLMHAEVQPLVNDAWNELARPDADEAKVMRLFDEASDKRRAFRRELTKSTLAFLATLTPQQRQKFVELARRPQRALHPAAQLARPPNPPSASSSIPATSGH
jgi:uncharacterized membrane protein